MTINVVCRKDAINRNHLAPLALVFTHDRRRKFVGLGISVVLEHWDFEKQQPTTDCPDGAEIQFQITSKIREYEKKIKKLEVLEIPVTFDTLFEQNGKRINCTVGEYFEQIIERLEKVEKYGSASKHKVTLALISQFRSVNMRFEELDLTYLRDIRPATAFALLRGMLFLVPSFVLLPKVLGIEGIWLALALSEATTTICIAVFYLYPKKRSKVKK